MLFGEIDVDGGGEGQVAGILLGQGEARQRTWRSAPAGFYTEHRTYQVGAFVEDHPRIFRLGTASGLVDKLHHIYGGGWGK
jgi:hypothetical protein